MEGGSMAQWHYKNGGEVTFIDDRVYKWQEPSRF